MFCIWQSHSIGEPQTWDANIHDLKSKKSCWCPETNPGLLLSWRVLFVQIIFFVIRNNLLLQIIRILQELIEDISTQFCKTQEGLISLTLSGMGCQTNEQVWGGLDFDQIMDFCKFCFYRGLDTYIKGQNPKYEAPSF